MNFFFFKRYILYFIFIYLIQITNENEQIQLERYKNAIYLLLTRVNGIIDDLSLTFEYNKYNITFKNFKILKPFSPNINIEKEINEENEIFLNVGDIMVTIEARVFIQLFIQKDEIINLRPIFFELSFNEIKFKLINKNEVQFVTSNIEMFSYQPFDKLFFFKDFNNVECLLYEGEKEPIILVDIDFKLTEILKEKFDNKIIENQKKYNILTYDMIQIFDNSPFSSIYDFVYITELNVTKMNVDSKDIILNKTNINIKYFSIKGKFRFEGYINEIFNYEVQCTRNNEHFVFKYSNNKAEIKFDLKDCKIEDDNEYFKTLDTEYHDEIRQIIEKYYVNYLKENADEYYNNIVDNIN